MPIPSCPPAAANRIGTLRSVVAHDDGLATALARPQTRSVFVGSIPAALDAARGQNGNSSNMYIHVCASS